MLPNAPLPPPALYRCGMVNPDKDAAPSFSQRADEKRKEFFDAVANGEATEPTTDQMNLEATLGTAVGMIITAEIHIEELLERVERLEAQVGRNDG